MYVGHKKELVNTVLKNMYWCTYKSASVAFTTAFIPQVSYIAFTWNILRYLSLGITFLAKFHVFPKGIKYPTSLFRNSLVCKRNNWLRKQKYLGKIRDHELSTQPTLNTSKNKQTEKNPIKQTNRQSQKCPKWKQIVSPFLIHLYFRFRCT